MKKKYPILPPIEVSDYDGNTPIDMYGLASSVKKEMEKVAKIEKCDIRELEYERNITYDRVEGKWLDTSEIIKN